MPLFFRQAGSDQFDGSTAYLESLRSDFELGQNTGVIEVEIGPSAALILLFARGLLVGVYHAENQSYQRLSLAEAVSRLRQSVAPICAITMPDVAGRALWLALESSPGDKIELHNPKDWEALLAKYRAEQFTGQVQVRSQENDGFLFFENGLPLSAETTFSTLQGFHSSLPRVQQSADTHWEITVLQPVQGSQAHRCTLLRLGACQWGNSVLGRYQALVGQKLLQTLTQQVSLFIQPRQWNIRLIGNSIFDQHFFATLEEAVDAYRELFAAIGEQADLVLGSTLSQRLLEDTYHQLPGQERAILDEQRLIPAAFSA